MRTKEIIRSKWQDLKKNQANLHISEDEDTQWEYRRINKEISDRYPPMNYSNLPIYKMSTHDSLSSSVSTPSGSSSFNNSTSIQKNEWIERIVRSNFEKRDSVSVTECCNKHFRYYSLERCSQSDICNYQTLQHTIKMLRKKVRNL